MLTIENLGDPSFMSNEDSFLKPDLKRDIRIGMKPESKEERFDSPFGKEQARNQVSSNAIEPQVYNQNESQPQSFEAFGEAIENALKPDAIRGEEESKENTGVAMQGPTMEMMNLLLDKVTKIE
jgi:hypothetical protein